MQGFPPGGKGGMQGLTLNQLEAQWGVLLEIQLPRGGIEWGGEDRNFIQNKYSGATWRGEGS